MEAQRAALSLRQVSLKNELLRMRQQQLIETRRERREELRAHVQRLEQQVLHYELSASSPSSISPSHNNNSWSSSAAMDRTWPFAEVDQQLRGSSESLIEKLVQQNEHIMALLLPRRHDANSLNSLKHLSLEVSDKSSSSSIDLGEASTGTQFLSVQNTTDEKPNASAHEVPVKTSVPLFQSPAALSWLPEFEWTDEDELALDKLEKGTDNVLDIPGLDNAQEANDFANTVTAKANMSKDQKTHDRRESRKKLEALLASLKNANCGALSKPRWRLEADGENDDVSSFEPIDAKVMDPLQIFRSAVIVVMFAVHLKKMLMAKKLTEKESSMRHFEAMLRVYFDATRMWLGKVVKTPLLSLLQDSRLDVDISTKSGMTGSSLRGFAKKFGNILARRRPTQGYGQINDCTVDSAKLLKLKVRMRGILQALSKAIDKKEIPSGILDFLKKISTDGVYFPPIYQLFNEERRSLEFDALGATRRMDIDGTNCSNDENGRTEILASRDDGFSRFNIVIINFLLVRILIPHVILQPWNVGIGSKNIGKQTSANLTCLATLLYCVCRQLSPLPRPTEPSSSSLGRRRSKTVATSQQTTNDESPASLNEIHPALPPDEPQQEDHNTHASSFMSIDEIGHQLFSDKNFPSNHVQVVQVIQEHQTILQESLIHLHSQLHNSQ